MKKNKSYWLKSGFYAILNQLTQLIFNLGTVMILFRILDKETCSVWVLFLTITSFIEIGRTGLLQNGLMTFLNRTPQSEHARINTASLFLNLSLSVVFVLILLLGGSGIAAFYGKSELGVLLAIYAATTFALSGLYQFNFIQQANMDFRGLFWSSCIKNGLLFFYVAYLAWSKTAFQLTQLAWCQLVAAVPAALVAYFFTKKYFILSKKLDWEWVKKMFHYGKYTFGTNMATMAQKNIDKGVIGKLILDKLSTYDLATKINQMAEVPTMTLAAILFPQAAKRSATEGGAQQAKYLYEKGVGAILALIVPMTIGILIFADLIVWIIGSEKYTGSATVLRLTVFYGFFMAFAMQFGTIMDSIGKPKLNFIVTTAGAVLYLLTNYIFIRVFGLLGAAYGTLLAMSVMFCVMQIILNQLLDVNIWSVFHYMVGFYKDLWKRVF